LIVRMNCSRSFSKRSMPAEASWRRYLDPKAVGATARNSPMHNGVRHTVMAGHGVRRFRYWEQEPNPNIEPCYGK
jgi:hypothetical protein